MTPWRRARGLLLIAAAGLGSGGCSAPSSLACSTGEARALPESIPESSGAAWSRSRPAVFWTVNDGREGVLFAVDTAGTLVDRVETIGDPLRDVEALAGGTCGDGFCLYLADTGDNQERRASVAVHRIREPEAGETSAARTAFPARFPEGPRDVEALFVFPGEDLYMVTKGRSSAPSVYRYPGPLRPDTLVVLEFVGALGRGPASFSGRITGASAMPGHDGLVLVRSYEAMEMLRMTPAGLAAVPGSRLNLRVLQEAQGEAVAAGENGRVVLTSEAGPLANRGSFRVMDCRVQTPLPPR